MERVLAPAQDVARHPAANGARPLLARAWARHAARADPPTLLTRDQLRMLEGPDNAVTDGGASMRRLGLDGLVGLDEQLRRAVASKTS